MTPHIPWTTKHLRLIAELRAHGADDRGIAAALAVYEGIRPSREAIRAIARNHGIPPRPKVSK